MIRLLLADLKNNWIVWSGLLVMALVCGYLGGWGVSIEATAVHYTGLQSFGYINLFLSSVAAIAILIPLSQQLVAILSRYYALWQLAGVRPALVKSVILLQLFIVATVGACLGTFFEMRSYALLFPWVFSSYNLPTNIVLSLGASFMPAVWIGVGAVFVLGGYRGACAAGRISPIEILRESESVVTPISPMRLLICVVLAIGVVLFFGSLSSPLGDGEFDQTAFAPILIVALFAACAPWLLSAMMQVWRGVSTMRFLPSFMGARSALHQVETAHAVEVPIMVGYGLLVGFNAMFDTLGVYADSIGLSGLNTSLDWTGTIVLFGGPVFLSCVGASIGCLLSFGRRRQDAMLCVSLGMSKKDVFLSAVYEATLHVLSATIVGVATACLVNVLVAGAAGIMPVFGLTYVSGLMLPAFSFVLVLIAIVVPTYSGLRCRRRGELEFAD